MNIAYFNSIIAQLNGLTAQLNAIDSEVNGLLADASSCQALEALVIQAAEYLAASSTELTAISTKATGDIATMQSDITAALAYLAPIAAFIESPPTTPTAVMNCVVAMLNTYAGPYNKLVLQEAVLVTELGRITDAVTEASAAIASTLSTLNAAINMKQVAMGCVI
jgi:ABC-type transporter Mla subunit MlaD